MDNNFNKEILRDALNLWWLRPENGLALASYCIYGHDITPFENEVAADYACGDGINTFFKCGGRFDFEFDLFLGGVNKGSSHEVAKQNIDVFNYIDDNYSPKIKNRPLKNFTYGTDHKEILLEKAEKLRFYSKLILANLNDEASIQRESLDYAYCNSLYWVEDIDSALKNIVYKVKCDGKIILDAFTVNKKKLYFENMFPTLNNEWHTLLNRGRNINNPGLKSEREWEEVFKQNNLEICDKRDIFPANIARFWNIGLRPIFPVLDKMVRSLTLENRHDIKKEWVELWIDLLYPLLMEHQEFSNDTTRYRVQYVLKRK